MKASQLIKSVRRMMVILAHPDDEMFCSGLMALACSNGAEVHALYATAGQRGTLDPAITEAGLEATRRGEAQAAAAALGVTKVTFLPFTDGTLQHCTQQLEEAIAGQIRAWTPDAVVSFDPHPASWDWHPDHQAVAAAVNSAVQLCDLPLYWPAYPPHTVAWRLCFARSMPEERVNLVVDIGPVLEAKIASLLEHESQTAFLLEEVHAQLALASKRRPLVPPRLHGRWQRLSQKRPRIPPPPDLLQALPFDLLSPRDRPRIFRWIVRQTARQAAADQPFRYGESFHCEFLDPMVASLVDAGAKVGLVIWLARRMGLERLLRRAIGL